MKKVNLIVSLTILLCFVFTSTVSAQKKLKDKRDKKKYKTVLVGEQVWMAENLQFKTDNSSCYDEIETFCEDFGRLYTWEAAKTACPKGWHLPDSVEWSTLISHYGKTPADAYSAMTSENHEFNLQFAGAHFKAGAYGFKGSMFAIWTADDYEPQESMAQAVVGMTLSKEVEVGYDHKVAEISVRCVKD